MDQGFGSCDSRLGNLTEPLAEALRYIHTVRTWGVAEDLRVLSNDLSLARAKVVGRRKSTYVGHVVSPTVCQVSYYVHAKAKYVQYCKYE